MSKYYDDEELVELIESVLCRQMTGDEQEKFIKKTEYFENPRYGYEVVKSKNVVLSRLSRGNYFITNFSGGRGFCAKRGGGCFGYIDDDLLNTMITDGLISNNGTILSKGFVELSNFRSKANR